MATFSYKAKKIVVKNGKNEEKNVSGVISAKTLEMACEILLKTGYDVLYIRKKIFDFSSNNKLSQKELISFFTSIASMDKVGVNLLQSLELMKNDVADSKNLKSVCESIYFSVSSGMSLSDACEQASLSFSHDIIGLIKIAEQTGKFYDIFTEIVEYIKWNFDTKTKAKKAIRGPLATIGFMVVMIIILSSVVLPQVLEFIKSFEVEVPWYTQILVSFSNFIKQQWYIALLCVSGFYFVLKILTFLSDDIKAKIDYLKLKIPIFGVLLLKIDTSRFITFFSIMYKNNADVLQIMDSVSKIVSNRYFGNRILIVRQKIADGDTIFSAINNEKSFPVMFRKMMSICEATGEVGSVLENVRYFYDTEVKDTTEKVVGLIKPMTTVVTGILVAWMGLSMLGPIYSNITNIGDITNSSQTSY